MHNNSPALNHATLWYPYTQMRTLTALPKMVSGNGVYMHLEDGRTLIDGISSWWSVIHGYNHPALNKALTDQISRFSHVMLGGMSHAPAQDLADTLVKITPDGLNHVFFSDSGSVGVEVALKMAIQYWRNRGLQGKTRFVSLTNGYHGDTFKAMEVSDDSDFTRAFAEVLDRGFFVPIPEGGFDASDAMIQPAIAILERTLSENSGTLAAMIVEPIVQCAGGFQIYSPRYLEAARRLCTKYNVLLIFDEIATGFGRTGKLFAAEHTNITPDIMILGKALTAGYMGHAATLATTEVFNSFLSDSYEQAFMHGPTFMANPLACTVALESIRLIEEEHCLDKIRRIGQTLTERFAQIDSPHITGKRVIGTIGAIGLTNAALLKGFKEFAMNRGTWLRPIGNVVYVMPPYCIEKNELDQLIDVIGDWIETMG